jgi:hypothetical protein
MTMSNPALENSDPSADHVPWDSIGSSDGALEELGTEETENSQTPLTPPAERSAAPDSSASDDEKLDDADIDDQRRESSAEPGPSHGGGWTLPMLCAGIALIACCVLIPQTDANRRLAYEHQALQRDLQNIQQQIDVNAEFLKKVADDPILAQRLAERQMKVIPEGSHVLELTHNVEGVSPFQLVNVAPPPPLPPYKPLVGTLANLCYGAHSRLYLIGISLIMIASGLVLGHSPQRN